MATATPTRPNQAAARDAVVEQAISAAANKVRLNDLFTGAAAAAVLALSYLAVMVVLDKLFTFPDWVRQLGLLGFLGGLAAVGYFLVVRPLRRRVNPRYVARQIEATLPDAKNVLINWVDLQDEQLPGSVKAAVGANAAEGVADADVDSVTSSRKVMWLGGAAGGLVLVLAILFLVFSASQFLSLVQRAVVPFTPTPIATQTTITLTEPEGGDATVTDGQSLPIAVTLDGRLPDPSGPDRARLLVRYDPESDEVVEVPLDPAGKANQFALTLGRGTLLNGLWYRVAAGDARSPEYKVTVRTRPMLGEFNATYKYPAYLKWPDDAEASSKLKAIRGTTVTLTVKANRSVDTATLTAVGNEGGRESVRGEVLGDARNHLRFALPLKESGTYTIEFKPKGEAKASTTSYPIEVEPDYKPVVEVTSPKEEELQLPLNGLLAVDGTVKDDHGIAGVELRFKVVGNDVLAIKPKVFRDGKPLVRKQDGTHLTDIPDYKDSVKLDALVGADGKPVKLTEKDVLEYWLAATDNCEPDANVGESARKRVRLLPAVQEPQKKQEQANEQQQRKQEEQKGEQKRDEQLKNEKRPEDQARNPNPERKPEQNPDGKDPNNDPMKGDGKQDGKQPEQQPNPEQKGGDNQPSPEEQKKADDLKKKIEEQKEQQKREGGDARGDGDKSEGKETPPSAEQKPQDGKQGGDGQKQAAEQKGGPPPEEPGKPESKAGEGKDGGKLTDPDRSETKPDPKPDAKGNDKPTGEQPKGAPKQGSEVGSSKDSKEEPSPKPTNPNEKPDGKQGEKKDGSAGTGRGAEPPPDPNQKPDNTGSGQQKPDEKKVDPKDLGGSKPKGEPTRGETKPEPKKGDGSGTDTPKPDEKKDASGAKGEAPTPKAESKDAPPKGDGGKPMPPKNPPPADACNEKEAPSQGNQGGKGSPSESKGEGKKQEKPTGTGNDPKTPPEGSGRTEDDKGTAKPSNTDPPKKGDGSGKPDEKDPKGQPQGGGKGDDKKLDPKEAEQAVKDLESNDPKTKQAAQEKLDKAVGKENREAIEKMQKDLKSDDKATREAAEKKLEEMKKEAQKNAQGGGDQKPKELTEQEKKELAEAAKNLDSKDPQTKKDAQEKLDKAVGKENREAIEKMQKDLKSDDKATREAAEKKLEEMAKEAQKNAQKGEGQKPRELTEAEKKELAEAAKNLNSKDEKARQEAEKKLDEAIGKQNREELQQDMKDLTGDDPQKAEQAREKLQKKIDEAKKNGDGKHDDKDGKLGGGNSKKSGKPLEADLENQLKAGELTLDDFKKYRGDKKFLKENNLTEAEYERYLKAEEARVQKLRDDLAAERLNPTTDPTGTPTVGRNDFSGDRVKGRTDAGKLGGSGGPAVAPPGFAEAQKRFAEEAAKRNKEKK